MSDITPITGPAAVPQIATQRQATSQSAPSRPTPTDQAEFSEVARYLSQLAENPVRSDLIDRVKGEIDSNAYDTPDKVDALLDELLDDLEV